MDKYDFKNESSSFVYVLSEIITLNHYLSLSLYRLWWVKYFFSIKGNYHLSMQY